MEVRPARGDEVPQLAAMLARAFHDDPVTAWFMPNEAAAPEVRGALLRLAAAPAARPGAGARRDRRQRRGGLGAARRSGASPTGRRCGCSWRSCRRCARTCRSRRAASSRSRGATRRSRTCTSRCSAPTRRPRAAGVGTAVLRPGWSCATARACPAYLESSKESNVGFYARFGFRVTERGPHAGRRPDGLADVAGSALTAPAAVLFDNDGLLLDTEVAVDARRGRAVRALRRDVHDRPQARADRHVGPGRGGDDRAPARPSRRGRGADGRAARAGHGGGAAAASTRCPARVELLDALRPACRSASRRTRRARSSSARWTARAARARSAASLSAERRRAPQARARRLPRRCAPALGADPARCVALEDSPTGVAAAPRGRGVRHRRAVAGRRRARRGRPRGRLARGSPCAAPD